jgi:hypothetical protein
MSSYKKFTCKRALRQVLICLKDQNHVTPPPHTHTLCIVYVFKVYSTYSHTELQSWVENTNTTHCISSL